MKQFALGKPERL